MNLDEVSSEYKFIFNRLNKLTKSLVGVVKQNQQLKEANEKLRKENDTICQLGAARERVIQNLTIKLGYNDPTRKNKMEDIITVEGTDFPVAPVSDIRHFKVEFDADGNEVRTEIPAPVFVQGEEGPVATEYVEV